MTLGSKMASYCSFFVAGLAACLALSTAPALRGAEAFTDVTEATGLKGLGGGVAAWVDYDADGWVDLWTSGQLWRNVKGKKIERAGQQPGGGDGIWADNNNDR